MTGLYNISWDYAYTKDQFKGGQIIDNLQIDNRQIDNRQIDNQNLQIDYRQIDNLQITFIS